MLSSICLMKSFDMKFLIVTVLALTAVTSARHITLEDVIELEKHSAYNYLRKVGVPLAEKLRKAEDEGIRDPSRIVGGNLANLGQFPYQAGLLLHLPGRTPFGGGILVNNRRILTAAHNLADAVSSVTQITVVLGSTTIFAGGTRLTANSFVLHENYHQATTRNDVAMIYLQSAVGISSIIAPIALPSGSQLNENFVGDVAVASGFGSTSDFGGGVSANQPLRFVNLPVISNAECLPIFPANLQSSNICTSGAGGRNICIGDSGGPLAVIRNNRPLLIGVVSFGSPRGCEAGLPSAYARVTSFMSWIQRHL